MTESISYSDARQLFIDLHHIRFAASPRVTLTEIEVHTGVFESQLSNLERSIQIPNNPNTVINVASKIIGWSIPLDTTQVEYEDPIDKKVRENTEYHQKWKRERIAR